VLAVLLATVVVAASLPMALAAVAPRMAAMAVICTTDGPSAVAVDSRGRPVAPPGHPCPDCLPHLPALALPAAPAPQPPPARARRIASRAIPAARPRPVRRTRVRDPPRHSV
jgi:hypothetical protein